MRGCVTRCACLSRSPGMVPSDQHSSPSPWSSDSIHVVGAQRRDEVATLMKRAAALLLPSRSEGWPLVIAESLACGTPVVASRVGGIPEIVGSDEGGVLVAPGDEGALAAGLVAIVERPRDPQRVASSSRAQPWRVQAHRIAAVYTDVLEGTLR
jgi:glycosyltransferase involved in cell wall biosynthesis